VKFLDSGPIRDKFSDRMPNPCRREPRVRLFPASGGAIRRGTGFAPGGACPEKENDMQQSAGIGSSIVIKGQVNAREDITIGGRVEGSILVDGFRLTIGPEATVVADVRAREIVVSGHVLGGLVADDRIELREGSDIEGNVAAPVLRMADGAGLRGRVDMPEPPAEAAGDAA
jgi:cytoskeletal protein CcmA (bactofilin family)